MIEMLMDTPAQQDWAAFTRQAREAAVMLENYRELMTSGALPPPSGSQRYQVHRVLRRLEGSLNFFRIAQNVTSRSSEMVPR